MTQTIKFGRQAVRRPAFSINELSFSSLPLSLAEEQRLAEAGEGVPEDAVMSRVLGVLVEVLNARAEGELVDAGWLMENLTPSDLEGSWPICGVKAEDSGAARPCAHCQNGRMWTLVLNCGSSSVKFALLDVQGGQVRLSGLAERLGSAGASARLDVDGVRRAVDLGAAVTRRRSR